MVAWRNRPIENLSRDELRLALEDAADEMLRARSTFGRDQFLTTFVAGALAGATVACVVLTVLHAALR
jgi:hypothetical protein